MKVLHYFKTFLPDTYGGIESTIHEICAGAAAKGVESRVLTLSRDAAAAPVIARDGYVTLRDGYELDIASTRFSLRSVGTFRAQSEWADVIHFHYPWPFADLVRLIVRCRKPLVVTYHSDIVKQRLLYQLYKPLMWRTLAAADVVVATSDNYVATSRVLQRIRPKTAVIPLGVAESSYPSPDKEFSRFWAREFPRGFFLFVGVFRYYKGLRTLVEASRGLDVPIILVGTGPEESQIRRMIEGAGLRNMRLVGKVNNAEKSALLKLARAVLLPSEMRSEAFGVTLVEGAMAGKPLVSCEIGTGTTYVNEHEVSGLVVPPFRPDLLRDALRVLWADDALVARFGAQARSRYERLFTAERMVEQYLEVYHRFQSTPTHGSQVAERRVPLIV